MKKLIIPLVASLCVLAVSSAKAQSATTNFVTFVATTYTQGPTNDSGTITTLGPTAKATHPTVQLLQEVGQVTGNSFSASAKLALIASHDSEPQFAVIDGANFVWVSNIMSFSFGDNRIKSGTQSDTTVQRSTTELQLITFNYDDTGVGGNLRFFLTGLGTIAESDTAPVNGTTTETLKGKITSMTGEGESIGNGQGDGPFVASGGMVVTGKGTLSVP